MRQPVFLMLAVMFFTVVRAQDTLAPVLHYDQFSGLPAPVLYNVRTDKKGFVWLASRNSLFRFDGKTFYRYTMNDGLCDNEIIELFPDSHDNIWCTGLNGKISLIRNGVVDTTPGFIRNWYSKSMIEDISEDREGNIYLSAEGKGLYRISPAGDVTEINIPGIPGIATMVCHGNDVWMYGGGIMMKYSRREGAGKIDVPELAVRRDASCIDEQGGAMWVMTKAGILFNVIDSTRIDIGDDRRIIRLQATKNFLLFSLKGGCFRLYDLATRKEHWLQLPGSTYVADMAEDRRGHLWVSTLNQGLYAFRRRSNTGSFQHLAGKRNIITAFKEQDTTWILEENGTITKAIRGQWPDTRVVHFPADKKRTVETACFIRTKGVCLLTTGMGTFCVVHDTAVWANRAGSKDALLYKDSLLLLRSFGNIVQVRLPVDTAYTGILPGRFFAICLLGDTLCVASKDGLGFYDLRNGKYAPSVFKVPGNGRIEYMLPRKQGGLLIATSNSGVLLWKDGQILYRVNEESGLSDNDCREIDACVSGLVVRHPMGLSFISHNGGVRTVTAFHELPLSVVNNITAVGDTLLLATTSGLIVTDIHSLFSEEQEKREVELMRVSSDGRTLPSAGITLSHSNNKLRIEYAIAEYDQPQMVQYAWQLNEGPWNKTYTTVLDLADLRPGVYALHIRARAPGHTWTKPRTMLFTVETPFWKLPLFTGGVAAILVAGGWLFLHRYYRRQLARQREKAFIKHQLLSLEQKALNAMMNPHFIFNAMASIQYLLNRGDTDSANNYLVKFSRLIRSSLEVSQADSCLLADETERLSIYLQLEKMRLDGRMDFVIHIDDRLRAGAVYIPSMILQTYVENAVIHGVAHNEHAVFIYISFSQQDHVLRVCIEDNGPGMDKTRSLYKGGRFGMAATEKRIALLSQMTGKKYHVEILSPVSESGGTRVVLEFPLK